MRCAEGVQHTHVRALLRPPTNCWQQQTFPRSSRCISAATQYAWQTPAAQPWARLMPRTIVHHRQKITTTNPEKNARLQRISARIPYLAAHSGAGVRCGAAALHATCQAGAGQAPLPTHKAAYKLAVQPCLLIWCPAAACRAAGARTRQGAGTVLPDQRNPRPLLLCSVAPSIVPALLLPCPACRDKRAARQR